MSHRPLSTIAITVIAAGLSAPHARADVQKVYWADHRTDKIQRANPDGSEMEDLVPNFFEIPTAITIDSAGGKMYWTELSTRKIQRANLDGSNVEEVIDGLAEYGVAVDAGAGKVYWTNTTEGDYKVQRADLDGSNIEDLVTTGARYPMHIAEL